MSRQRGSDRLGVIEWSSFSQAILGEPPRPLGRVASGGELSRIMLALKTVLAEMDQVPVLVFDEIDTGVGGAVAAAMGNETAQARGVSSGVLHHPSSSGRVPSGASSACGKGAGESTDIHVGQSAQGDGARRGNRPNVERSDHYEKVRETAAELIARAKGSGLSK